MPMRAPLACPAPGCGSAQPCAKHPRGPWAGAGRAMPAGWPATRRRVLARDRWCCRLGFAGCEGHATDAHHTVRGCEDEATIVAACGACHRIVTQQQASAARWIDARGDRAAEGGTSSGPDRGQRFVPPLIRGQVSPETGGAA